MVSIRTVWVSETELSGIWEALHEYRFNTNDLNEHVESIMLECGVARTRAEVFYPAYVRLAVSLGKEEGSIPLKLNSEEYSFLTKLPLKQELKEIIQ